MTSAENRKGGGPKSTRSETVTVRLDQKSRYLAELAARKQRRTLSSYIEWAIQDSLKHVDLHHGSGLDNDDPLSVEELAPQLWNVSEAERFAVLAIRFEELLNQDEQERWKVILDSRLLSPARVRTENGNISWDWNVLEDKVFPMLREHWSALLEAESKGKDAVLNFVKRIQKSIATGEIYPPLSNQT